MQKRRQTFLLCSRCCAATVHTLLSSASSDEEYFDVEGYRMHEPATYSTFQCNGCTLVSLYIWSAFHEPHSEFGEQIFPPLFQEVPGVPHAVQLAYRQAENVRSRSNEAYAVLARKTLEAIVKDRGMTNRNLAGAMRELATKGDIPPLLAEAATLIRTFGNIAAHDIGAGITEIHVQMIKKFLAVLIEHLYVTPAALRDFKYLLDIEPYEPPNV